MCKHVTPAFLASQNLSPTFPERFWRKVVVTDGCWGWTGCKDPYGYGQISSKNPRYIRAHVASWILNCGPIPNGMHVLHKCDCPPCSNFQHLFLGTHQDNMRDCKEKGRFNPNCFNGSAIGTSKLSEEEVKEILESLENPRRGLASELARRYNVSPTAIYYIKHGMFWRHISRA